MENIDDRRAAMAEQAKEVVAEARRREEMAKAATQCITGVLAQGLREQGITDKAIAATLGVSRNRVGDLAKVGIWGGFGVIRPFDTGYEFIEAEMRAVYRPRAQQLSGWLHTRTDRSGTLLTDHDIPLPKEFQQIPGGLDTDAAEFRNIDTGELVLVYTLERHTGKLLFDSAMRRVGEDGRGSYRIDLISPGGERTRLPPEILAIQMTDLRFGRKWADPSENRTPEDAFRNAAAAVRRHYGIWPLPSVSRNDGAYWTGALT